MSLLNTDSHDHYSDIALKYSSDSTAVIAAGTGRKGTAGVVTNGTTFFTLDRVALNEDIEALTLIRTIAMRLDTLPAATQTIMQFQEADGTNQVCVGVLNNGTVRAFRGNTGGTSLASSAFPIAAGIYYYIECKVFIDNVAGTVEVRLWPAPARSIGTCTILDTGDVVTAPAAMFTAADLGRLIEFSTFTSHVIVVNSSTEVRVADTNSTGDDISGMGALSYIPAIDFTGDTQNGGTGTLAKIKHGLGLSASWDDGVLLDTEGGAFNSFPGNIHIEAHFPNGAGFYTNWVPVPSLPNYSNVDENPPDEDASYNYAPSADPVEHATVRSASTSTGTYICPAPTGIQEGDILVAVLRFNADLSGRIQEGFRTACIPPWDDAIAGGAAIEVYGNFAPPASAAQWNCQVMNRLATASEPADYEFFGFIGSVDPAIFVPLENVLEIAIICYTGVNQAVPCENRAVRSSGSPGASLTVVSFTQVDTLTDNDLIGAVQMAEFGTPISPAGYTQDFAGTYINVSSKVNPTAGGVIVPGVAIDSQTWATIAFSLKANAVIETGSKDTFNTQDTTAASLSGAMVNLCTRVDEAGHTVGAVMREDDTDSDSDGVVPTTDYLVYQFPYETAPDAGAWTAAKFNASESGYALDAEEPPVPPEEAVILWIEGDQITGFSDGDQLEPSFVEAGIHTYTMSLAHAITGDFVAQTYQTGVGAVNNQTSIEGITESLACTPATRNTGYVNTATNGDLFLPDAFTLICVFNLTQYDGCWQSGDPVIITRRGTDAGADFAGWILTCARDGPSDPGGSGKVIFYRFDSVFAPLCTVASEDNTVLENQTYIVTVICDGTTLRMRLDGVEVDTDPYATDIAPLLGSDLWFLGSGDGENPPQGQVPYTKIWSVELDGATLAAEEAALAAKYQ